MRTPRPITYQVDERGCHVCTSHSRSNGYPQLFRVIDGRATSTSLHRLTYRQHFGEIPAGLQVRHRCDNRACINPEHLLIGTNADNVRDAVERGRMAHGEVHTRARLTERQVKAIRRNTKISHTALARRYGVTVTAIASVRSGRTWRHLLAAERASTPPRPASEREEGSRP